MDIENFEKLFTEKRQKQTISIMLRLNKRQGEEYLWTTN